MRINTKVISCRWTDRNRERQCDYTSESSLKVITASVASGRSGTISLEGQWWATVFGRGAFNRNNYTSPTTNYTMQVFVSDA